jgi:hypothetical protein
MSHMKPPVDRLGDPGAAVYGDIHHPVGNTVAGSVTPVAASL